MREQQTERGFAMIMGLVIVLIIAVLSTALVYSSAAHHLQSMDSADGARALALAEGAASLLLVELSDDPLAPVKNVASFVLDGSTFTRSYEPFDAGDGSVRVEVAYLRQDNTGAFVPVAFADRADPVEPYDRVQVAMTGLRPRARRVIEIDLEQQFVLLDEGAIVSDSIPPSTTRSGKALGHEGHVVFDDKGRRQVFVHGNIASNGGVFYVDPSRGMTTGLANSFINFAGTIAANLAGTPREIPDYTAIGSSDQLFDFGRFIAAARAGAGQEFTRLEDFVAAMNAANAKGKPLEGIIVLSVDPATEGRNPKIEAKAGGLGIPGGIHVRGTLLFNLPSGTDPLYKVFIICALDLNPADLGSLDPSDPSTYGSGYDAAWNDGSRKPSAVDISAGGYRNFVPSDDLPALMFNTGVVDIHGPANVSGLVYGPSFIEIENKKGNLQYFNGAVLGGAGVYVEGHKSSGTTVINFDAATINLLATQDGKGEGLKIISWRTLR